MVHDTVAQKNFDPVLPPLPESMDEEFEEESVKIVRLVKNKEPLVRGPCPEDRDGGLLKASERVLAPRSFPWLDTDPSAVAKLLCAVSNLHSCTR